VSPRRLQPLLGYALAAACLVWVLHGVRLGEMFARVGSLRWGWVAVAIGCDVLSYLCQGVRWMFLLRPTGRLPVLRTTQAIYAGLFTNEIVPLRVGELVRAYLVSRWMRRDIVSIFPSMAVERLCDGVWTAIAVGVTALLVTLPRNLMHGEEVLGVAVLAGAGLFAWLALRARREGPNAPRGRWARFLATFAEGLRTIGLSRHFALGFLTSAGILIFEILAFWLVARAYGIGLSLWAGAAVLLIVHLGTALPNAPSNLGTYQFFTVVGLSIFRVDKTIATGFSLVVFVLLTIPLWALGLAAIGASGMTLGAIRREIARLRRPAGSRGAS
jgi:glycosyltransferase 2 family protein